MAGYYNYFSFGLSSYIDRLLIRVREEVLSTFSDTLRPGPSESILDVGVSADDHVSSNHFEKRYPYTSRICALGVEYLPELVHQFPGIKVVQGDARALPFADSSFDFVYSHAVIEHVGCRVQQSLFLQEALRVARKGVLLTTPNRWHPIESHTGIPILHFFPPPVFREVYRLLGKTMYASEDTLNLLSRGQILKLVSGLQTSTQRLLPAIHTVHWLGFTSNLILVVRKH